MSAQFLVGGAFLSFTPVVPVSARDASPQKGGKRKTAPLDDSVQGGRGKKYIRVDTCGRDEEFH